MSPFKEMSCWDIMQCSGTEDCPARKYPDIPCWDIAEKLGTKQSAISICADCIVYVIKMNKLPLSNQELDNIMKHRNIGKYVESCPAYTAVNS